MNCYVGTDQMTKFDPAGYNTTSCDGSCAKTTASVNSITISNTKALT